MQMIGIGDLHLSTHTGHSPWSRFEDYLHTTPDDMVIREVKKIYDYAVKHGVPDVAFYGDLCHGGRMSYAAHMLLRQLIQSYPKITTHMILGNHDWIGAVEDGATREIDPTFLDHAEYSLQLLDLMRIKNLKIYANIHKTKIQGVNVNFMPYPHPLFEGDSLDENALNVFHKEVAGAMHDNGAPIKGKHSMAIKKKYLGVAGHLHTNQRVHNIFYAGSVVQNSFGEKPKKFFHHIKINITDKARKKTGDFKIDEDDWEVLDVPIKQRYTLRKIQIKDKADWKKLPNDPNVLVQIRLDKNVVVTPERYEKYAKHTKIVGFDPYSHQALDEEVAKMDTVQMDGEEVIIDPAEFFRVYLASKNKSAEEIDELMKLRQKIKRKVGGA